MSPDYKVGAKLSVVVPPEPGPMSVVIDAGGNAWQNRPGPDVQRPWKSTEGEEWSWVVLVSEQGPLKLVHLAEEQR
ncbi:MAG TPA: hypothetical protein VGH54_05540 [Mycobacterium sp.]|uniref:hypothetical protein n=1 Tax=Mycobacterium sp. TaxID=1785 RepID=UPI002F419C72